MKLAPIRADDDERVAELKSMDLLDTARDDHQAARTTETVCPDRGCRSATLIIHRAKVRGAG